MALDENRLVELAKEGDSFAFEKLFLAHKDKVYVFIYRFVQNRDDTEDLLQETFTKAFLSIKNYEVRNGVRFISWLFKIGVNCALNFIKKRQREEVKKKNKGMLSINQAENKYSDPELSAQKKQLNEKIYSSLDCLSAKQRVIFVLRHFQGFKIKEIASYLGSSEGNVKKQLFRAFLKMEKRLKTVLNGG